MLKEIAQEARDRIAAQESLWKWADGAYLNTPGNPTDTCTWLALSSAVRNQVEANPDSRFAARDALAKAFIKVNNIQGDDELEAIYAWNDTPGRTVAGAVAALDKLVNYLATQEGE